MKDRITTALNTLALLYLAVQTLIKRWIKQFGTWLKKLHVAPWTRYVCNKIILRAIEQTNEKPWYKKFRLTRRLMRHVYPRPALSALYNVAKKGSIELWHNADGHTTYEGLIKTIPLGGAESYISMPPGYGHTMWPDAITRCTASIAARVIAQKLDDVIVSMIANHTKATERIAYKKCLTQANIDSAIRNINTPFEDIFSDSDGSYWICVTSNGRIETQAFTRDGGGWEDMETYADYFDRPLYPGEYGRLKMFDGFYIVFLTTLNDQMQFSLLFGPDALTVTPIGKTLRTLFRRTPKGEEGEQPRGYDLGFSFRLGAVADKAKCVVLEATKRVGGKS